MNRQIEHTDEGATSPWTPPSRGAAMAAIQGFARRQQGAASAARVRPGVPADLTGPNFEQPPRTAGKGRQADLHQAPTLGGLSGPHHGQPEKAGDSGKSRWPLRGGRYRDRSSEASTRRILLGWRMPAKLQSNGKYHQNRLRDADAAGSEGATPRRSMEGEPA